MSSDVKSMHLGKITSFFIPTVTLVGEHSATPIPDRLRIIGGKSRLWLRTRALWLSAFSSR